MLAVRRKVALIWTSSRFLGRGRVLTPAETNPNRGN